MSGVATLRSSTIIWGLANAAAVGAWLNFVRELWHHTKDHRCQDAADSFTFIVSLFPLAAGIVATAVGLFFACTDRPSMALRRGTITVHAGACAAWLVAGIFACVRIRIDMAVPC